MKILGHKNKSVILLNDNNFGKKMRYLLQNYIAFKHYYNMNISPQSSRFMALDNTFLQYFKNRYSEDLIIDDSITDSKFMSSIFRSLPYHFHLQKISLRNTKLGNEKLGDFLDMLQSEKRLKPQFLDLTGNLINIKGVKDICEYIESYNEQLNTLNLSSNFFGDEGV